jgi:ABC-type spermidine/putrescine transport system permease subunit I
VGKIQGSVSLRTRFTPGALLRRCLLALPIAFITAFLVLPLAFTFAISFWPRAGLMMVPGFTLASYVSFFGGVRLLVLERSLVIAAEATILSLLMAYPIAWFLATRAPPAATRVVLLLITVPFLINYIIRTFAWTWLLDRSGPVNGLLEWLGITSHPISWLLYSRFAIFVGLISSYMPFMIFPLWLAIDSIDRRLYEASWMLGAGPFRTFLRITLLLSLPGVFAAAIFGFVGCFGDSAVPVIMGGVGFQLVGNSITGTLDVLNYPLAAAMSSVVVWVMLLLLACWFALFDIRSFLGKILLWRRTA